MSPPGKVRDVVYKTLHAQGAAGADEAVLLLFYKPLQHRLDEVFALWAELAEAFDVCMYIYIYIYIYMYVYIYVYISMSIYI